MLDVNQFRLEIVRPALLAIGAHSEAAENLVLGTAIQESRLTYLRQIGGGPALGLFQMEPATHGDIWSNYLAYRPKLAEKLHTMACGYPVPERMIWDLRYAAAMCRVHYKRAPAPLPPENAIASLGQYWKDHYNTASGAGTADEFTEKYHLYVMKD